MTSRYVGIAYCKNPICIPKSQVFQLFSPNARTLKSVRHEEQVIWYRKWEKYVEMTHIVLDQGAIHIARSQICYPSTTTWHKLSSRAHNLLLGFIDKNIGELFLVKYLTIQFPSVLCMCTYIFEWIQNHRLGKVGMDYSGSSSAATSLLMWAHPENIVQDCVHMVLQYLQ